MDEARYFVRVVVTRENRSDEPCTLKAEISVRDSELEIPVTESPTEVQVLRRGESKRFFHFALQGTNEYIVGFVSKLETSAGERNSFEFGTNIPDARGESWRALVNGLRLQYAPAQPNAAEAVESSLEWQNPHLIRELLTTHSRNRRTNWKPQITPSLIGDLPGFDIFAQSSENYTWPAFTVDLEVPDDYSLLDFIDATATLAMEFESQSVRDNRPSDATIALFFHWLAVNASYGARFPVIHLSSVSRLAAFVTVRYRQIHRLLELREAIRSLQSSIDSYDPVIGYKQRDELISALAMLLCEALSATGPATEDVESATLWCTEHIIPSLPQGSAGLNNFAQLYMQRYECLGGLDDLNININILQTAISSPPPDLDNSERAFILHNMTRSLHCRYISLRQHTDLELALRYCQESLDMEASGVKLVPRWELLSTLGEIIKESDPNGALAAFRESKQLCPPNDPLRYLVLHRLAMARQHRNITHGQSFTEDEEESKALEAEALLLIPNGNRLTKTDMLLNSIQQELPNVRSRARIASDFDGSIAKAVDILQIAGDLPTRHAPLYIVGTLYYDRFILSKESHDIAEAHRYLYEALQVASTGPGISNRANILARLARIHLQRGTEFFHPEVAYGYLEMCLADTCCTATARLEHVARNMHGALQDLAQEIHLSDLLPSKLADVYIKAVHLFSEVAPLNVDLMSSLEVLRKWGHFVSHASMLCHLSDRPLDAVKTLEEVRAAFWSQILQTRVAAPSGIPIELNTRLRVLSQQVERIRFHKIPPSLSPNPTLEYSRQMRIWEEYSALVKEIRRLPEAAEFLSVPLEDIVSASKHGPIIILFSYTTKTVAYILHSRASNPHDPFVISEKPFSALSQPMIQEYIAQLHQANRHARGDVNRALGIPVGEADEGGSFESSTNRDGERAARMRPRNTDAFTIVLKNLWIQLVKPILDELDIKPSKARRRPRMWWCPTGDLAFLPIHAAGDYSPGGESCADYVVSSYTPTVTALTTARKAHEPIRKADLRVLLTGAPHPCQGSPLYETVKELNRVAQTIPPNQLIPLPPSDDVLLNPRAGLSVPTALAKLPDASILHLASHGIQDFANPLNSGFLLRDAKLSIAQLMPLPLPHAFLAFLSACETARGDQEYNDQVVHLAATLLFAGFKSVIGTMWSMSDIDGPVVASHVYKRIFSEEAEYLDPNIVPYALDEAVQELRAKGVSPSRWSTFIHLGI